MAAQSYKNVQNISFSEGSTGVPAVGDSSANIGALTGTGNVTPQTKINEESSPLMDSAKKRLTTNLEKAMENFSLNGDVDVKVIGFEEKGEGEKDKKRRKRGKRTKRGKKGKRVKRVKRVKKRKRTKKRKKVPIGVRGKGALTRRRK